MAITWTTAMYYHISVNAQQLIWKPDTCSVHLRLPGLQISCTDLTRVKGHLDYKNRQATYLILSGCKSCHEQDVIEFMVWDLLTNLF